MASLREAITQYRSAIQASGGPLPGARELAQELGLPPADWRLSRLIAALRERARLEQDRRRSSLALSFEPGQSTTAARPRRIVAVSYWLARSGTNVLVETRQGDPVTGVVTVACPIPAATAFPEVWYVSCEVRFVAEVDGQELEFTASANALQVQRVAPLLSIALQVNSRLSQYSQYFAVERR